MKLLPAFLLTAFLLPGPLMADELSVPTGGHTPQGAACDIIQTLCDRDFRGFSKARPRGGGGGDTLNDIANHYVSFVTETQFHSGHSENAQTTVSAQMLLKNRRLRPVSAEAPVRIPAALLKRYETWAFGAYQNHSYVDVTLADQDGERLTTRMVVVYAPVEKSWKGFPIGRGTDGLYRAIGTSK